MEALSHPPHWRPVVNMLCPSTLAAGRSHQSRFHANPTYVWLPRKEALKCLWGSGDPGNVDPAAHSLLPLLSLHHCPSIVPIVCQRGWEPITGKPHFKHLGRIWAWKSEHDLFLFGIQLKINSSIFCILWIFAHYLLNTCTLKILYMSSSALFFFFFFTFVLLAGLLLSFLVCETWQ